MKTAGKNIRKGLTLVDVVALTAILVVTIILFLSLLGRMRAGEIRAACESDLSSIAKALKLYGGEFNDSYPWICSDSDKTCAYNFRSDMRGLVSTSDFYTLLDSGAGTKHQNTCENLNFLPFYKNMVSYKAFLCPASPANLYSGRGANYGFLTPSAPKVQCLYGYHAGWKYIGAGGVKNPAPLDAVTLPGDFVIMADMNPNKNTPFTNLNSQDWSHGRREGINILRADASVFWSETVNCDLNNHSIYMSGSADSASSLPTAPMDKNDSVLYVSGQ